MACQGCESARIVHVSAKCDDRLTLQMATGGLYQGYNPGDLGIGAAGDYLQFAYCLNCGRMQDVADLPETDLECDLAQDDADSDAPYIGWETSGVKA